MEPRTHDKNAYSINMPLILLSFCSDFRDSRTNKTPLIATIIKSVIKNNCSHSFVAYIDKNFNARDYFTADFQIEIPEITPTEKIQASKIPTKEVLDIDLIRINISSMLLMYILKSIFTLLKQRKRERS